MTLRSPLLPSNYDLTGKTALITGGGGLLGIEHAKALNEVGAKVIITDKDYESLSRAKQDFDGSSSGPIDIFEMDVTSEDSIRSVHLKIKEFAKLILN